MYRIAVVEDDRRYRQQILSFFEQLEEEQGLEFQVSVFSDGIDIVDDYKAIYDLILLDIDMPLLDGMTSAERIRTYDEDVLIMFITNLAQYAIRGYSVNAMDYVLKPMTFPAFSMKIQRACKIIDKKREKFVLLHGENGTTRVSVSNIYYIEVADHLLTYHTTTGDYRVFGVLKNLEEQLGDSFVRCNQCYLVNLNYVEGMADDVVKVHGASLKISRSRKKEFMQRLSKFYQSGGL